MNAKLRNLIIQLALGWLMVTGLRDADADQKPNILWISCEDISAHLGCYGQPHANTPTLDRLASQGVRYNHAFTVAGVCAVNRSAMITGMYATSIGTQHMRCNAKLPDHIRCFPEYLRRAGYYCTNNSKTDYNFRHPASTWDESSGQAHWKNRRDGQPFFAVFNLKMTHESCIANVAKHRQLTADLPAEHFVDPHKLTLPPYYPDTPIVREDWARYFNNIAAMDRRVAQLLEEVKDAGLDEETIVFFWSDHGVGLPRGKRWLYDSGTRIPLIVRVPERWRADGQAAGGTTSDELVSSIDLAPTVLRLAGVEIPEHMHGRAFLGKQRSPPRQYVYGHRDRMDERYDIIRMVRDKQYKYLRNYESWKAYYQYMNTPEKGATMQELRRLHQAGRLPAAAELFMAEKKPLEELYDVINDPHELNNLADSTDEDHQTALNRLRQAHTDWIIRTRDTGLIPEPELVAGEQRQGSRYAILHRPGSEILIQRIRDTAQLGLRGIDAASQLAQALEDRHPAVRYWAAIGLGNLGRHAAVAADGLTKSLNDVSAIVRVASARALCHMGLQERALGLLSTELQSDEQWVRLNAAIVLDEIDEQARPVIPELRQALQDKQNKYVVRVANRALNELLGSSHVVP